MALYFQLLSQPIKINEALSLFSVSVSNLIIIATKLISHTTKRTQYKTSSQVTSTYKRDNICLLFNGHSFTYFNNNKKQNHINTWEVLKIPKQSIFWNTPGSSPFSSFVLTSSDIMLSYIHWSSSILTKHSKKFNDRQTNNP